MTVITPQITFPLRRDGRGGLQIAEQGSPADIASRLQVLCRTRPGQLEGRPDFGITDPRFQRGGVDAAELERQIQSQIEQHVGRDAVGYAATVDPGMLQRAVQQIDLTVTA